jgi:hypothetical protein
MIKKINHIILILLLLLFSGTVQAQVISIQLELPAGIQVSTQVIDPIEGGTWENSKARLWIELEARENLGFLLDLQFPEREILPPLEAYFLNDGSADFEKAGRLPQGTRLLRIHQLPMLIHRMHPRPIHLQAWLGLPLIDGMHIKIEYP